MPAPSVIERIALHIVDSLNGVRITAGYAHDFDCQRRQRGGDAPTRTGSVKVVLDQFGRSAIPSTSQDASGWFYQFGIDLFADSAEDLTTPIDEDINSILADAEKALVGTMEMWTRGGLALDTTIAGDVRFTGSVQGAQMLFSVQAETGHNDPLTPMNTRP